MKHVIQSVQNVPSIQGILFRCTCGWESDVIYEVEAMVQPHHFVVARGNELRKQVNRHLAEYGDDFLCGGCLRQHKPWEDCDGVVIDPTKKKVLPEPRTLSKGYESMRKRARDDSRN